MAGTVFPLLDRVDYNYTSLGVVTMSEMPLVQNIDVSQYVEGTLLVRTHAQSIANASSKYIFRVRRVAPTDEDPAQYFRDGAVLGDVTIQSTTISPSLTTVALASMGGWVSLSLVVQQGAASASLIGTFSVDLSLKE